MSMLGTKHLYCPHCRQLQNVSGRWLHEMQKAGAVTCGFCQGGDQFQISEESYNHWRYVESMYPAAYMEHVRQQLHDTRTMLRDTVLDADGNNIFIHSLSAGVVAE